MDPLTRLVHASREGDEGALEDFVHATYEQVRRLCAALVDEQSAGDLAQETFVAAVRALPRFRGDSSGRTWLLAIARHKCLDELRSRTRRRRRDTTLAAGHTGETPVTDAGQEALVSDLIGRLDTDQRSAFVLTQILGFSYDETARICECPTGTIRSRVTRARAELLDLLEEPGYRRPDLRRGGYSTSA